MTRIEEKVAERRGEVGEARVCHHLVLPWVQFVPFFFQQLFPWQTFLTDAEQRAL